MSAEEQQEVRNKYDAEFPAPQKCGSGRPLYGVAGAYMIQCRSQLREEAKVQGQKQNPTLWGLQAKEASRRWKALSVEERRDFETRYRESLA